MKKLTEKIHEQFFKEKLLVIAKSKNISLLIYPIALCKLGPQKKFAKKGR